jgi:tetratricopeptide (TPR) repeat protein
MITRCSSLLFILASFVTKAQDSLVYLSDLTFSSPFEKSAFTGFSKNNYPDQFHLFIANGSLLTESQILAAHDRFYDYLKLIDSEKLALKKADKKVKTIVSGIQNRYLMKYVSGSRFEDIFYNGNFSELAGTALYCLAFEYFKIPYEIKEEANNVYVIAYPQSEKIQIESTIASIVFTTFDEAFQRQFVETLRKQRIISEQEVARNSTKELFNTYYFNTKSSVTISGLAGLHYLNDGITLLQQENFESAFHQFEKAYFLNQSPKAAYMLMHTGGDAFLRHTNRDLKQAALLGKTSRYRSAGITDEMISGEFYKVIQDLLFNKNEKELLANYYQELLLKINNFNTKREISFFYNFENGRYLYNQARYRDALPFFEETLKQKPTNLDAATIMINTLIQMGNNQAQSEDYSKKLIDYSSSFPALSNNNLFNGLVASSLLMQQAIKFEEGKPLEGESYRKRFEELYAKNSDLSLDSFLLGKAYSAAATFYFKKGQTKKAQEYLSYGLKLSPDNYELKTRQRMIR